MPEAREGAHWGAQKVGGCWAQDRAVWLRKGPVEGVSDAARPCTYNCADGQGTASLNIVNLQRDRPDKGVYIVRDRVDHTAFGP
jgi:hypothetical protein